jgi:hypothetical protein
MRNVMVWAEAADPMPKAKKRVVQARRARMVLVLFITDKTVVWDQPVRSAAGVGVWKGSRQLGGLIF